MEKSLFFARHSKRAFVDREVPRDTLERLFERIRWSPSCSNNQPWRFIFVCDPPQRAALMTALADGNQWAAKAPVLVVLCARRRDDLVRNDDPVEYYSFDCGLAAMSLLLGAVEEGLMGHPMAGYSCPGVKAALGIPEEYHVVCVIALGYEGSPESLDETTRRKDEATRTRKPLNEVICIDRFGF